ncbi:kinase-like domain-containing protein [Cladorrhinum sp. PSN259]|nr:kinase-like domain-containing protein [Cladorrhinum sp. PSN259]
MGNTSESEVVPIHESSFFKNNSGASLPLPSDIRAINKQVGTHKALDYYSPSPVKISKLGLLVKYGADVRYAEYEAQLKVYQQLQGRVRVPELYGWAQDGQQGFIYMALIEGQTMEERWKKLSEKERKNIFLELRGMINAWRALPQPGHEPYIGGVGKQPLNDVTIKYKKGPFTGTSAIADFERACKLSPIEGGSPITFTHGDLVACNILLAAGPNPKVAAVIDWGQAGWYPAYWEYCKAMTVGLPTDVHMSKEDESQWREKYVPLMLGPVDEETCFVPYLMWLNSWGL